MEDKNLNHLLGTSDKRADELVEQATELIYVCNTTSEFIKTIEERDEWTSLEKIWIAFKMGQAVEVLKQFRK